MCLHCKGEPSGPLFLSAVSYCVLGGGVNERPVLVGLFAMWLFCQHGESALIARYSYTLHIIHGSGIRFKIALSISPVHPFICCFYNI